MHLVKSFWGWDQLSQSWSAVLKAQLSRGYFSVIFGAQQSNCVPASLVWHAIFGR